MSEDRSSSHPRPEFEPRSRATTRGDLPAILEGAFGDVDALLGIDDDGRHLKEELAALEGPWSRLSSRLSGWEGAPQPDLFTWSGEGWIRPVPGLDRRRADLDSRPSECVRGLVEGLVEEERIGAWICSRPGKFPSTLRLRTSLENASGDLEVQVEARGPAARVRVQVPADLPVASLSLCRGEDQLQSARSGELSCELAMDELEALELVVELEGGATCQRTRLPLTTGH